MTGCASNFQRALFVSGLLGILLLMSACASVGRQNNLQTVMIRTHPPGADIYYKGKKLSDKTPALVRVQRGQVGSFDVVKGDVKKTVEMRSRYRWGDSFASNLSFLMFAPVGWVVDFITGAAWEYQPFGFIELPGAPAAPNEDKPPTIAIAPPKSGWMELSDAGGDFWQQRLRDNFPDAKILPYSQTRKIFNKYQYDYNSKDASDEHYDMLRELKADYVFESEFKQVEKNKTEYVELKGEATDVYTSEIEMMQAVNFKSWDMSEGGIASFYSRHSWLHLIANTPELEYTTHTTNLNISNNKYSASRIEGHDFFGTLFSTIESMNISYIQPPRNDRGGRFTFNFAPAIRLRLNELTFPGAPAPISGIQFRYSLISAGYEPELGYQFGRHYFYVDVTPFLGWHRLSWSQNNQHYVNSLLRFNLEEEIGYRIFITSELSVRVFGRSVSEPDSLWTSAISDISGGMRDARGAQDTFAGISLGYTFIPKRGLSQLVPPKD